MTFCLGETMADPSVRSLAHLQDSASTARVLNLLRTWKRHGRETEYLANPLFENGLLNRSIILKHRLRRHELELFGDGRQTATKVIIPIDSTDLKLGGWSLLVGQENFESATEAMFGGLTPDDDEMLQILDQLPSLDPFLLREHLKRNDRNPARIYFEISDADLARMISFVEGEVRRLIDLCFAGAGSNVNRDEGVARLVRKILSISVDADTEPLRLTLRLAKPEYQEGVFCWKGFLYYKWTLSQVLPDVREVVKAITEIKPRGPIDAESKIYLAKTRETLRRSVMRICDTAKRSILIYDTAFESLIGGQPTAFRDFLLSAPAMFTELGERLGAVNHIISFWNFRFPRGRTNPIGVEELIDIFNDFEASLSFTQTPSRESRVGKVPIIGEDAPQLRTA
jgi:hypothetical protein